jgi:hypothetical protein
VVACSLFCDYFYTGIPFELQTKHEPNEGDMNVTKKGFHWSVVFAVLAVSLMAAHANVITYLTPPGGSAGGQPVDASAIFSTTLNTVTITLWDCIEATHFWVTTSGA